ncbi:hypothetical protein [Pseudomonas putida]|uniref:hypothetical protein n=1 Tax=Pseudomonas putida TaxID=303 RepID=UPI00235C9E39|nr:hypothetical protein [Pseudomonas putida]GLO46542.1 hypothetical protein PPUN109347_31050 [Pseudomonas putida]HDS0979927.1 hypothetical protein [Pseudomonas putida]
MDENAAITADALELLLLNQTAIRAALEELSLWVSQRGSVHIHDNVMAALATLDTNTEAISIGIERLRA